MCIDLIKKEGLWGHPTPTNTALSSELWRFTHPKMMGRTILTQKDLRGREVGDLLA
jgi:hypothetical protein